MFLGFLAIQHLLVVLIIQGKKLFHNSTVFIFLYNPILASRVKTEEPLGGLIYSALFSPFFISYQEASILSENTSHGMSPHMCPGPPVESELKFEICVHIFLHFLLSISFSQKDRVLKLILIHESIMLRS